MKVKRLLICLFLLVFTAYVFSGCAPLPGPGEAGEEEEAPVKKQVKAEKKAEKKPKVEEEPAETPTEETAAPSGGAGTGEKPSRVKKVTAFPFYVYKDGAAKENHYYPSGWMGDYGDLRVNVKEKTTPHSGMDCIKITYSAKGRQGAGWAGIYWQQPANNWGTANAGYDISGANKCTFWAQGEKGNEVISEFKVGGIQGEYSDTDVAGIGPVQLSTQWKQYTIDLRGKDLSRIAGGFCWAASGDENPDGFVMYLDDIVYEK